MKKKIFVNKLSNKNPTKDITLDDIKYKIPKITERKKITVKVNDKVSFSNGKIPIIAGPNGVESRELIFKVAKFLKKIGIKILRGHAYKPLTFPYRSKQYLETMDKGMDWLDEVKRYTGLSIVTEVTEIKHLDRICSTADILQIGSRNMANLELLKECAKTNKTIILKRHYGASLRDMFGAAEHILIEGAQTNIVRKELRLTYSSRNIKISFRYSSYCSYEEIINFQSPIPAMDLFGLMGY